MSADKVISLTDNYSSNLHFSEVNAEEEDDMGITKIKKKSIGNLKMAMGFFLNIFARWTKLNKK